VGVNSSVSRNKQGILAECSKRSLTVAHLPFYYHVHLNMPCNQKCIMCVPDGKHPRDLLPFDEFARFFDQIKASAEHLTLIGGEPLMYPWIREVLDLLAQHEIAVTINTNATILNERLASRLLALHELNLKCSIDAMTRAKYFKIRGMDSFDRVTGNMRRFAQLAADKPHIRMILVYTVMRENLAEVLPFIDLAKEFRPFRVDIHPVRHVSGWHVTNDTGWVFDGKEQSCEFFTDEYNEVMRQAAAKCDREGLRHDIHLV
jgi:molybdenum cofactor biosynthesis enzyme MoaA